MRSARYSTLLRWVRVFGWFGAAVVAVNILLQATDFDIQPLQPGIDVSYIWGYGQFLHGTIASSQVFATYGPLGFLVHAVRTPHMLVVLLVCNVCIGAVAGLLIWAIARLLYGRRRYVAAIVLSVSVACQVYEWRFAALLLLLLLYICVQKQVRYWLFGVLGAVVGLLAAMKLSLGIIGIVSSAAAFVVLVYYRRQPRKMLIRAGGLLAVAAIIGLVIGLGTVSPVTMVRYVYYGLQTSNGYTSAMALDFVGWQVPIRYFLASIAILAIAGGLWLRHKRAWLLLLPTAASLFFVWKAAIVRQDPYGHVEGLAMFLVFIAVFIGLCVCLEGKRLHWWYAGALAVASVFAVLGMTTNGMMPYRAKSFLVSPLTFWKVEMCTLAPCTQASALVLPADVRQLIGNKTIDIYPWQLTYAPVNNLQWRSRPAFASYAAYTPAHDAANAAFFASGRAPQFILWHLDTGVISIDNRFLLYDEPETARTILHDYRTVYTNDQFSLLERRTDARPLPSLQRLTSEANLAWGAWSAVPQHSGLVTARVDYRPDVRRKLATALFRPTVHTISLRKRSGAVQTYRWLPGNLSQGIIANQAPFNTDELKQLLAGGTLADDVVAIRINGLDDGSLHIQYDYQPQ